MGALDLSGAGSEAPGEPDTDRPARRKDAARKAWGEGDPSALSAWVEPAAAHLLEVCGVARGQRLLDVAAGDGNLALAAVQAGAEVTAADFSPVLVERGRERTRASGADVEWNVADVEALPYADESFDCVASNFGVIYADDSRRAVAELERVVRPGGTVALTAWASSGLMARVLRLAVEREGAASPGAKPERWGRYETAFLHFSRFDDFEMLDATLRMEFDSREEMWSLVSSPPGPLAGALRAGGRTRASCAKSSSAWSPDNVARAPLVWRSRSRTRSCSGGGRWLPRLLPRRRSTRRRRCRCRDIGPMELIVGRDRARRARASQAAGSRPLGRHGPGAGTSHDRKPIAHPPRSATTA